ncbi:MAG: ROK family protein [Candidatus Eisenbacteria bacterium]|nr:ROK family protein [Candidatus Eisenbacteria bacterium]
MKARLAIGIDLGGTTLRGGIFDETGNVRFAKAMPVEAGKGKDAILGKIFGLTSELVKKGNGKVLGIGVGSPGTVDFPSGKILGASPNLPGWCNIPLKSFLERRFSIPVYVDNDANAATLGEAMLGAGKGHSNFMMVTLGTGIGGGLFLDGKLFRGSLSGAGEIGHMTLSPSGPICGCGGRGCLESFSSATAIGKRAENLIIAGVKTKIGTPADVNRKRISAKTVFDRAKRGDRIAVSIVDEAMLFLGAAIGSISNLIDPDAIVLGGGMSLAGDFLLERVRRYSILFTLPTIGSRVEIKLSRLRDDAGVLGAGLLVFENLRR